MIELWRWMDEAWQDLRFGTRILFRSPGFTMVAAVTLALGIGANTAVFSILHAVLLQPLPYKDAGRLVTVFLKNRQESGIAKMFNSYRDFEEYRHSARTLSGVAVATWGRGGQALTNRGRARGVLAITVSASFFEMLGVSPALGRTFNAEDETRGCSLVLADRFWRNEFGADLTIVGQSLTLEQRQCTVLGVMPPEFHFYPAPAQMWTLLDTNFSPRRETLATGIFARLQPGVSREQAQAELQALYRGLHQNDGNAAAMTPVVESLRGDFIWLAGRNLRKTIWVLAAAVGFVLLIACLNVANLQLGRSLIRERELAVRAALGSGQGRLIRQLLTEGFLLSLLGSFLGVVLALGAVRYFRFANPVELPVGADVGIHAPVLLFTALLSVSTTLAFGLLPAYRASRVDLNVGLKAGGRGAISGGSGHLLARALVAAQIAVAMTLLAGGALLMESFLRLGAEPLGFDSRHLITTGVSLPGEGYADAARRMRYFGELHQRVAAVPGVTGVAFSSALPPHTYGNETLHVQGKPEAAQLQQASVHAVTPDFLAVLGIPLLRGRLLESRDDSQAESVALVNESLVHKYFAGSDPIGQRIRPGERGKEGPWLTVVGVMGNLKNSSVEEMTWEEPPILYRPLAQDTRRTVSIAVRTAGDAEALGRTIQQEIGAIDGTVLISNTQTMESILGQVLAYPRFRAVVLAAFSLCALALTMVGLHGVLAQMVVQRTQEFGVRIAVGAQTGDVFRLVARQGGVAVVAGVALGVASTIGLSRGLASLLYGVRPAEPLTLAGVVVVLLVVAGTAISLPARRAARVDPMVALREE